MNCLEFRRSVGAEPYSTAPEIVAHAAACAQCARYQQEMQQMEALIQRSLQIPLAAPASSRARATRRVLQWGLAASVLLGVAIAVLWLGYSPPALAEQLGDHVRHEAASMVRTNTVVDGRELQEVLAQSGVRLQDVGPVSYAMSCSFRGHQVPHLVVQTDSGPVTVILLPREQGVTVAENFDEGGYRGVILPAPRGAIAVLGHDAPLGEVGSKVLAAIEYIG